MPNLFLFQQNKEQKMKKLISAKESIGKQIVSTYYDDGSFYIVFTDDTYIKLRAKNSYDDLHIECCETVEEYYKTDVSAGIITNEEYNIEELKRKQRWEEQCRKNQRKVYEELKTIFEGQDNASS